MHETYYSLTVTLLWNKPVCFTELRHDKNMYKEIPVCEIKQHDLFFCTGKNKQTNKMQIYETRGLKKMAIYYF